MGRPNRYFSGAGDALACEAASVPEHRNYSQSQRGTPIIIKDGTDSTAFRADSTQCGARVAALGRLDRDNQMTLQETNTFLKRFLEQQAKEFEEEAKRRETLMPRRPLTADQKEHEEQNIKSLRQLAEQCRKTAKGIE